MDSGYSLEKLVQAYFDCRRRKRTSASALRFEQRLEHMPDIDVYASGNSYLGLARQADANHHAQAQICRALLKRGHAVEGLHLTKAFRKRS